MQLKGIVAKKNPNYLCKTTNYQQQLRLIFLQTN